MKEQALLENVHETDEFEDICDCNLCLRVRYVALVQRWSEQSGVSLSVESAQARIGRPLTPLSVAGVARRHYRRAAYGYRCQ
jgi:hypothetical protein